MPPKKVETTEGQAGAAKWGRVKTSLKMGVVGLPNVGKSSLFNLLTDQSAQAENFPFCTIDPNEAQCGVPDQRFKWLCDLYKPRARCPAAPTRSSTPTTPSTRRDLETIQSELCKKDLAYVTKQIEAHEAIKKGVKPKKLTEAYLSARDKIVEHLTNDKPAFMAGFTDAEIAEFKVCAPALITTKPIVYLVNLSKKNYIAKRSKWLPKIAEWIKAHGGGTSIPFSVEYEEELFEAKKAGGPDAVKAIVESNGGAKSVLPRIIKCGYKELNLIYFFTAGEKEVRAWNIYDGPRAPGRGRDPQRLRAASSRPSSAPRRLSEHCGGKPTMANLRPRYRQEATRKVGRRHHRFKFNVQARR
ncbi:GTP binding protein [Aureococcus anophagefferens]|nr:GTP binding protein [Aureococcus anophagefferens]